MYNPGISKRFKESLLLFPSSCLEQIKTITSLFAVALPTFCVSEW